MQQKTLTEAERLQLIATLRELGNESTWRHRLGERLGAIIAIIFKLAVVVGIVYAVQWWTAL